MTTPNPQIRPSLKASLYNLSRIEGPRGKSVRASVALRYGAYLLTIVIASALISAALASSPWASAGSLSLVTSAIMATTCAAGTLFMPHKRQELIDDLRHFLFQLSLLPGVAICILIWVLRHYEEDSLAQDQLYELLSGSLPVLLIVTLVLPAIVYVKAVAGRRHLERVQQDNEEGINTWMRHDQMQL